MSYMISEILGKEIVCLSSACSYGIVTETLFDAKMLYLMYLKTSSCLVSASEVFRADDCVCCESVTPLPLSDKFCFPIGKNVYTSSGKKIGVCNDVEVANNFTAKLICCDETKISPKKVLNAGDTIILRGAMPKREVTPTSPAVVTENKLPKRHSGDFSFLVGCKLSDKILDKNGKIMANIGQTVTAELITVAMANGKLMELNKKCLRAK